MFDIGAFRSAFPEFANTVDYPDQMIAFWAELAEVQVRSCIWKPPSVRVKAMDLYVAHEITLARLNVKASSVGGTPGVSGGIANNKTVGGATIGYDTTSTAEKDAGYWNLTNYGKQFIRLVRIFGAGCIQL